MSWTATPAEIELLDRTIERLAPYFEKPDIGQDNVSRVRDVIRSISSGGVAATMESTDLQRTLMFCKLLRYLCAQPPPIPAVLPYVIRGSKFFAPDPWCFFWLYVPEAVLPAGTNSPKFRLDFKTYRYGEADPPWTNGVFVWGATENLFNDGLIGSPYYLVTPRTDFGVRAFYCDTYRVCYADNNGLGAPLTAFHYTISDQDET